jgi:hypothetical protein
MKYRLNEQPSVLRFNEVPFQLTANCHTFQWSIYIVLTNSNRYISYVLTKYRVNLQLQVERFNEISSELTVTAICRTF